ncbi:unnamed protein product [Discosporangium mesarthrocarpum]
MNPRRASLTSVFCLTSVLAVRALILRPVAPFAGSIAHCAHAGTQPSRRCSPGRMSMDLTASKNVEGGDRGLSRRKWLKGAAAMAAATAVAWETLPGKTGAPVGFPQVAEAAAGGLPASGFFIQHAVIQVDDMDAEVQFFTQGLGMQVVRQREVGGSRNVFVAYGPESLASKGGGYFSLELVQEAKGGPRVFAGGGPFRYLGLTLPEKLAMVGYKVDLAGGTVVPHWFATRDFAEFTSPSGVTVRVKEGKRRDPFTVVGFASAQPERATKYFRETLGMKEQGDSILKVLGPLAGEANRLSGYDAGGVSVALLPSESKITQARGGGAQRDRWDGLITGGIFKKLAILTRDTQAAAKAVEATAGPGTGKVLFSGPVPGIGTKVANTVDFEGRGVVFVDYDDFESEMSPPALPPAPAASDEPQP